MQKYDWFEHGMQADNSGDYCDVAEADDKIKMLEDSLADESEENIALKTTIDDLQDQISKLREYLDEIQQTVREAMR